MALTDSLDNATQQILALLQFFKLSNARVMWASDTGAADNVTLSPTPAITSYGPDLIFIADINFANATTTPRMNISGLGWIPILAANGSAPKIGAVAGKCMFGFSSVPAGGYAARLLIAIPENVLGPGEGTDVVNNTIALNYPGLAEEDTFGAADIVSFFQVAAEGGIAGGHHRRTTFAILAAAVLATVGITGPLDGRYAPVATPADFGNFALASRQFVSDNVFTTVAIAGANPSWGSCSNGIVTVDKAGLYCLTTYLNVDVNAPSNNAFFGLQLLLNGAVILSQSTVEGLDYYTTGALTFSDVLYLNPGDQLEMQGYSHAAEFNSAENSFLTPSTLSIGKIA